MRRLVLVLVAGAGLLDGSPAAAQAPNLVAPRPGEVIASGGVKVRVLPRTETAPEACCLLEFQRWADGRWVDALTMAPDGVGDPVGVDFTRRTFDGAERWRVRARFDSGGEWSAWRDFTVPADPAGPRVPAGRRER
jgi:hypothetical protein